MKQNEIQIAKIKSSAKNIYDKYGSKELIMKNINNIKIEIAKETKDPEERKMMAKRIKSLMDKEELSRWCLMLNMAQIIIRIKLY